METSRIPDAPFKTDPPQAVPRDPGDQPAVQRRSDTASNSGQGAADRAEFTPRAQIEAARGQAGGTTGSGDPRELGGEAGDDTGRVQGSSSGARPIADGPSAADAAREASAQIRAHPALAALAQANNNGAAVLAMLV
jgi:hypothetical protein